MGLHLIPRTAVFRVPQDADHLQQLLRCIGRLWGPVQHTFHLLLKRYCKLYRSCCGFSSKKPQFSSIFHGFLRFSQKQDGILRGIPPCCSFFLFSAYSCAPHLLQNSASSETGAPHCGQVLRGSSAGAASAAGASSAAGSSASVNSTSAVSAGVREAFRRRSRPRCCRSSQCIYPPAAGFLPCPWPDCTPVRPADAVP